MGVSYQRAFGFLPGYALAIVVTSLMCGNAAGNMDDAAANETLGAAGCSVCHSLDQQMLGPSYLDIAAKYGSSPESMAQLERAVREGSTGVWGQLPMVGVSPELISDADLDSVMK